MLHDGIFANFHKFLWTESTFKFLSFNMMLHLNGGRDISGFLWVSCRWKFAGTLILALLYVVCIIGGFHAISGDTNNNGETNKCCGQTKRANVRSFVYRPPSRRRWRNVSLKSQILGFTYWIVFIWFLMAWLWKPAILTCQNHIP